jgi:mono/diheme cytochrome c family protein
MRQLSLLPLLLLALLLPAPPAGAQTRAESLGLGRSVAETWCANCHLVATGQQRSANDAAPSFASIAARQPEEAGLRTWLSQRHKDRMPNFDLSRAEVDGVVAYILSLPR